MIFIAILPNGLLAFLLLATSAFLVISARTHHQHAPGIITVISLATLIFSAFAALSLWSHAQDPISREACTTGLTGMFLGALAFATAALFLAVLFVRRRPLFSGDKRIALAALLCVTVAWITCTRSAILCTV